MSDIPIHYHDEMKVMGYGESDTSGEWIKLQLPMDALEKFRGLKGQRFAVTMVMIGDDEQPTKVKGGKLSHIAAMLCEQDDFRLFVEHKLNCSITLDGPPEWLRDSCGIKSRAELDHDPEAAEIFAAIRSDFLQWKRNRGGI